MTYHGKLTGSNGQTYLCEHNHRTQTAAITCANSSATRRLAEITWKQAAVKQAEAAALAKKRAEERAAAQADRIASREAAAARQAAAKLAAEEAKAAKRAAKLAAMPPERAWKRMTPEERLLKTAETELEAYGKVLSSDAKAAYDARASKRAIPATPKPSQPEPPKETRATRPAVPSTPASLKPASGSASNPNENRLQSRRPSVKGGTPAAHEPGNHQGCELEAEFANGFDGDGLFVVGLDISQGVYRTAGPIASRNGYFALLKSTSTKDIIENGIITGTVTITVGPGVKAVSVQACQPWKRLGDDLDQVIAEANNSGKFSSRR